MRRHWSLRTRFLLAASACLVPLLVVVAYVLYQSLEHSREQLIDVETAVGEVVQTGLESALAENADVLTGLAADDGVQRLSEQASAEPLSAAIKNRRYLLALFLIEQTSDATSGSDIVAFTGPPDPNLLRESMDPAIQRSLQFGEVGVSPPMTVELSQPDPGAAKVVAITVPVYSGDTTEGQPIGALGALLSVKRLESALFPFGSGQTAIAVVGSEGDVIASRAFGLEGDLTDQDQAETFEKPIAAALNGTRGDFAYEDSSGEERLAVYVPVDFEGADWTVLVTSQAPTTYGPNRTLLQNGILALATAVVATLLLALFFGEAIARPLRRLTAQASAIAHGDFAQPLMTDDHPNQGDEVGRLRIAFRDMAARLAMHVNDLELARRDREFQADELRDLHRRTVRLQEDERRRIAGEIHDAVSPLITGALYQARALRLANGSTPPAERDEGLSAVGDLLARATDELHGVIFDLRPPDLDDLGVVAAIERFIPTIQRTGLACTLELDGTMPNLTPEVRLGIYRIVQEALHNVVRHAGADEALVRLEVLETLLQVTIRDNGAGFDAERAVRPTSLGLLSMRERAAAIGASFQINSTPGLGTAVVIERPFATGEQSIAIEDLPVSPEREVDAWQAPALLATAGES
ncbi:MAG: cache domain-containing protein [Thermomicrobiales bacterium]